MKRGDFRSRIDPKPPLNEETVRKLREKTRAGLLERERKPPVFIFFVNPCFYEKETVI